MSRYWGPEERLAFRKGVEKAQAEQERIALERIADALEEIKALLEKIKQPIDNQTST